MADGTEGWSDAALALSIGGLATQTIGAYFGAKSAIYQGRSQALSMEFERTIASLNARQAEIEAQQILEAGRQERGMRGVYARLARGQQRARLGAAGVQAGVGSAAERLAGDRFAYEADALTIDLNAARAASAARRRGVDYRNQALFAGVNAANARRAAGSISPTLAGFTSLVGGAGTVARDWLLLEGVRGSRS